MKKEEIHWEDWHRILFGTAPVEFALEVMLRTVITYALLIITLRLMGKRMGAQLTIAELAIMLTLGAIVSVAMQAPDKGVLQGLLVLVCALCFQRGLTYMMVKNKKVEHLIQGASSILVKDGVLLVDELAATKISKEQVLAVLRNKKVYNLGEIQRLYIEACGLFSLFKFPEPRFGLPLAPNDDHGTEKAFVTHEATKVCKNCGAVNLETHQNGNACSNCNSTEWIHAVKAKSS